MIYKKLLSKTISINLSFLLLLQQSIIAGDIVSDVSANSSFQATVEKAPNGIPVVNIVKPNETGLSHNKFSDYNVNKEGVILNNSNQREVNTQLAGYIYGNKNLAGRNTASTILNEVTSRNKTELRGFTEVAGDRANVVVANPNGIYINGAGFINTQKATITTGNISATNGNINHRVENGTIEIDGDGLNVSNVDKAELYAKTVKLNAQIHAKDIDIITGKNNISSDGKIEKLSQEDTSKPEVSIDSSSLGGIYANKISLIGTQDGVGVNLPIEIAAQDNLKLSADGKITVDKAISQKSIEVTSISSDVDINNIYGNSVKIEAKNELNNKNIIASKTDINLKATKIVNENVIASGVDEILKDSTNGSINITSDELENKNTIYAKDNVNINTKEVVNTKESIIKSKKEINITSENISNEENVSFEAAENINLINQNKIVSNKINIVSKQASVNIETNTLEIKNSKVNANKDVILKAEEKIDAEDINVQANKIDISTKELILSQKKNNSEDVDSKIVSNTTIDITANNIKNVNGYIGANENINITSKDIENSDGIIVTNKNLNIDSPENGLFNNLKGILQASKNLVLNVFDFKGDESIIQAENVNVKANDVNGKSLNIVALNGDLKLDTNNLNLSGDNQSKGLLYSTNDILINSKKFISNYLNVQTNNNIDIRSLDITLNNSTIQSVVDINDTYVNGYKQGNINLIIDKLDLNNTILASKDLNIKNIDDTKSQNVIINNSTLDGNNDINLKLENLNLNNSSLLALNNINIENSADMIMQDEVKIEASNDLVLNTNNLSIFSDNSQVVANNNLNLNVINKFVNLGILKSKNTTLNTNYLVNYGFVSALNNLTINAYDIDNKAGITVVDLQNENQKDSILTINANNLTNYNTIYVNGDMNLNIKNQLLNKTDNSVVNIGIDKATIFAVNNLNIGNEDLGLRTEKVVNDKALIQTKNGDINIFTNSLENLASELKVYGEYVENTEGKFIIGGERIDTKAYRDRGGYSYNYFTIYTDIMTYEKPEIAQILSGKDIYLNTNSINNKYSLISANNDIYFESNVLTNKNIDIVKLTTTKKDIYYGNKKCRHHGTGCYEFSVYSNTLTTYNTEIIDTISSTIEAGGIFKGTFGDLINGDEKVNIEFKTYNPNSKLTNTATDLSNSVKNTQTTTTNDKTVNLIQIEELNSLKNDETYELPTNKYGMFTTVNPNKNLNYLVESNPLYTNISNFTGSQYFLDKMNYQGDRITKRLGDAAYETKLITDSIVKQTGQRFLGNYTSENAQFVALMDSAINLSGILGLEIGQALTQTQLSNLTEDIVWMEEKIVADQKVLVPVVYLAKDYEYLKGATITAQKGIDLKTGNLTNTGTMKSGDYLKLDSKSITNNQGVILANGKVTLISDEDFINKNGGLIKANEVQIASINGSIINQTFAQTNKIQQGSNDFTYTLLGNESKIQSTNGNLILQAKNNIDNIGASLDASKTLSLTTQTGDINFKTLSLENGHNVYFKGGFDKALDIEHLKATASAGENIVIKAGNNINLEASKLNAVNQINLNATNDVNITAVNDVHYKDVQTTSKGFMSKKTQRDTSYKEEVNSAELNANDIVINAQNNVSLEASKLKAQDNIIVFAKEGDVNVLAKTYKEGELHQTSKSSWGGLKKSLDIKSSDALKLNSALLETQAANVVLRSGKDINILASEINSGADIQLKALNDVLIASQQEYLKTRSVNEKSSFNILGLSTLVVPVGGSIYTQEIHKNDKVSSTNKQSSLTAKENIIVDSGTTNIIGSNLEANNISIKADTGEINILSSADITNETSLDKKIELSLSNPINMIKGQLEGLKDGQTKLKFEVGRLTYDEVDKASQNTINNSSNLIANNNIVLDSLSDINITGSNLISNENIALNSQIGDINIQNSVDTSAQDIKEKHAKASLNLTVQNEYVETAQAVKSAVESAEQLKQTKDDYSTYKSEVKKLENTLVNLKQSYKNKEIGVDYSDIEDLIDTIDNVKSQEKYYVAAIAAASADLASKTVAIATQAETASTSGATAGFSVGVSLDVNGEKSKTNTTSQTSNASNLNAKNIYVNTDEKLSTNTNIVGSNLIAQDNLNINTTNLNVKASQDNYSNTNDSENVNGSVAFTMYGGGGGTAGLGYGQQNSDSNTLINNNSILQGNNVNINASNDAIFQGANVKANDTLNLNVGNNLVLESLRDEYSSNSNGFNVNAGIGFGSAGASANRTPSLDVGKQSSTNAGFSINNGTTLNKQTVLSSITGNEVNVNVGNNTHLKGALLASGEFQDDGNFVDNKNLNFTTNTLSFENLSNSSYSSNQSIGGNFNYNLDSTKVVDGKEKTQQGGISSVGYNASNGINLSASKTLATLGQGNVTISDIENSDDLERLNTDTSKINKELYSSSTGTSVDATLDTRLLTEEGRKQIAEDMERTKRLGQAIGDVAIKESVSITDSFNHIDDVQKDLDVQKQVAINDNGKIIDTLENQSKYSVEQVDKALNDYAQIYADVYGVNIQTAKTALLGKYGSTYTNKDNTNSNVSLDKILNQNALQTANILGHEVAHVRQNQGQTYLRETTELQEEYSDIFGKYSSSGLDFSSNTYNNVQLSKIPTNNLNLTSQDINILRTNTNLYLQDVSKANSGDGRIDDESYWTLQDMDRTKDLQSDKASDRIKALIETGNTESEILKQVINDGTLRGLSQEEFNKIYSEQKQQVDDTNKLVDIEANSLKTISLALGGREITKNILESISKKTVETSIKNAIASGVEDLSTQVGLQIFDIIYNEPAILNQINNNPADTLNEIYNKIDLEKINLSEIMIASTIGSFSDTKYDGIKELKERILARNTILNQINNPNLTSTTKKLKLEEKLSSIDSEIKKRVGTIVTPIIIEQIVTQKPREIIEGVLSND